MNRREAFYSIAGGWAAVAFGSRAAVYGAARADKKRLGIDRFSLPISEQVELEESNIKKCLCYASERLNL